MRRWIHGDCREAVSVDRVSGGTAFFAPGAVMQSEL